MQPNIVLIMTDQQRRQSLGIYGCGYAHTPHLDALGKSATVYDHCYCNAPVCTPSRACTLTGKTLPGHGVYNLFDILPGNEKLLPYYLRENGYATALIGKLHVSGTEFESRERNPYDGFDLYELCHEPSIYLDSPFNGYARWLQKRDPAEYAALVREGRSRKYRSAHTHFTTYVSERSAEVIKNRDKSKPLFLMAGYFDPHNPYDHYPKEAASLLHEECYEAPAAAQPDALPEGARLEAQYHCPKALGDEGLGDVTRRIRTGYFAGVSFIDQQVQKIFDALKEEGIYDDTLIIFTSDHGDMLGDHGLYSKGAVFYEQGVNVPLLVKFPGQQTGARSQDLVQLNDLFATCMMAAGLDCTPFVESLPLQGAQKRAFALTEYRACGKFDLAGFPHPIHATMIRTPEWKLNLYHDTCEAQLFCLKDDPGEMQDLSHDAQHQQTINTLTQLYLQFNAQRDRRLNAARGGLSAIPGFAYLHKT